MLLAMRVESIGERRESSHHLGCGPPLGDDVHDDQPDGLTDRARRVWHSRQ